MSSLEHRAPLAYPADRLIRIPVEVDPAAPLWPQVRAHVAKVEKAYLEALLAEERGVLARVAERAGIKPKTLWEKMRAHGLTKEAYGRRWGRDRRGAAA
jgi:DNA-binding NtrC family response regulator